MSLGCPRCGSLLTDRHYEGCDLPRVDSRDIPDPRLSRGTSLDPTGERLRKKIADVPPLPDDTSADTWHFIAKVREVNEYDGRGWFAHLEGSWESLFLAKAKPNLTRGDYVDVVVSKRNG